MRVEVVMFWRWTPIVSTMAVAAAIVASPVSSADPPKFQYVTTVSGAVRCVLSVNHVSCERSAPGGFPDAPPSETGSGNMNVARLDADGSFSWGLANMGAGPDGGPLTLEYDQPYHIKGWSVAPSFDGTRFTNDGTGHGMFVSIDGVDHF
jgi:hypothetical protein